MTPARVDFSNVQAAHSPLDQALAGALAEGYTVMGQVAIAADGRGGFRLSHRADAGQPVTELQAFSRTEDAEEIARYDDAGAYRPLKTAPNLRRGWRLELPDLAALRLALECFYPGRLGAFVSWKNCRLPVTSLRETLGRQTGMYRVTQKITDEQAVALVGRFCRSEGGCARTILWGLNAGGGPSSLPDLPAGKFDAACDQIAAGAGADDAQTSAAATLGKTLPMFCQEPCNLLVAEARAVVKGAPASVPVPG